MANFTILINTYLFQFNEGSEDLIKQIKTSNKDSTEIPNMFQLKCKTTITTHND